MSSQAELPRFHAISRKASVGRSEGGTIPPLQTKNSEKIHRINMPLQVEKNK
jgi:hypothetical protein